MKIFLKKLGITYIINPEEGYKLDIYFFSFMFVVANNNSWCLMSTKKWNTIIQSSAYNGK